MYRVLNLDISNPIILLYASVYETVNSYLNIYKENMFKNTSVIFLAKFISFTPYSNILSISTYSFFIFSYA